MKKLTVKKLTSKKHCLVLRIKGKNVAYSASFSPKAGPDSILGRINATSPTIKGQVRGVDNCTFEITDSQGLLLESIKGGIFGTAARQLKAVMDLMAEHKFTV